MVILEIFNAEYLNRIFSFRPDIVRVAMYAAAERLRPRQNRFTMCISVMKDNKRATLIRIGQRLFSRHGYRDVNIEDVAKAAGMSTGSFYTYFESKEDFYGKILDIIENDGAKRLEKIISSLRSPINKLKVTYRFVTLGVKNNPMLRGVLADDERYIFPGTEERRGRGSDIRTRVEAILVEILRDGTAKGLFRSSVYRNPRALLTALYDAILHHLVGGVYTMCTQGGYCDHYLVVEYSGDVYPCDFFVEKTMRLGNITRDDWEKMRTSARYRSFAALKAEWNDTCSKCEFLRYCSGDCLKQRYRTSRESRNVSWLCKGWKEFYARAIPDFKRLAVEYLNERQMQLPPAQRKLYSYPPPLKIGWNDPCFCGSGKKYKLCHAGGMSHR